MKISYIVLTHKYPEQIVRFKNCIVNDDLKYIDWENPNPTPPAILGKSDFHRLVNSPKLFARKFDITRDAEILDLIDQQIL